jgi:hypothetical protein
MKPSSIYFVAAVAAEKALPAESRRILEEHDALNHAWANAGAPIPVPAELTDAAKAVDACPFATAALVIRRLGNEVLLGEWRRTGEIS